jgi:hypothetical protein
MTNRKSMTNITTRTLLAMLPIAATQLAHAQDPAPAPQAPPQAPTEPRKSKRTPLGVDLGVFRPNSERTRALFGDNWSSFGPGIGAIPPTGIKNSLQFRYDVLRASKNGNNALVIPIGVEYKIPIFGGLFPIPKYSGEEDKPEEMGGSTKEMDKMGAPPSPPFAPYLSFGTYAYATQLRAVSAGLPSRWRTGNGFTVTLGTTIGQRTFGEFIYQNVNKIKGIDLSGYQIRFGVRF